MRTVAIIPRQQSTAIVKEASFDAFFAARSVARLCRREHGDVLRAKRGRADGADTEALLISWTELPTAKAPRRGFRRQVLRIRRQVAWLTSRNGRPRIAVPETNGAVKDKTARRTVGVAAEIAEPLELHGSHVIVGGERRLQHAAGQHLDR